MEAYELLGCGLVAVGEADAGLEQWRKALSLRNGSLSKTRLRQSRIAAFDDR